jgi:hypothetical protein
MLHLSLLVVGDRRQVVHRLEAMACALPVDELGEAAVASCGAVVNAALRR